MIFQIAGPDGNVGSRNEPISHTKTIGGVNILQNRIGQRGHNGGGRRVFIQPMLFHATQRFSYAVECGKKILYALRIMGAKIHPQRRPQFIGLHGKQANNIGVVEPMGRPIRNTRTQNRAVPQMIMFKHVRERIEYKCVGVGIGTVPCRPESGLDFFGLTSPIGC